MVVGTGAVRMSVPIVPAQTIKQVNSTSVVLVVLLLCIFFFLPTNCFAKCNCINGCFLQVAPKPLTSAAVVTTTQTQQRLIMPATPLPQIQPNFTNLPPGTVLAQAPGGGNVGYAIVPAQYVTQVSTCVCVFVFHSFFLYHNCTQASPFCLHVLGWHLSHPATSICDPCQQLQFLNVHWCPVTGQNAP